MHIRIRLALLFYFCLFWASSFSQERAVSPNPPDISWQQLGHDKVEILFPKGLEQEAARVAAMASFIDKNKKASIGNKNYDLTIILHARSMFSNGFVTTSPFRSEFFGTPIQDWSVMGSLNWLDLLAIHEYRHALQFSNADRGITKVFHILSGQLGWNVAANLSIPDWFWEGDATLSETLQTNAGRGRNPSFSEEQRAIFELEKTYPYQVVRNGSFVKRLPSHYPLGYQMNLYARLSYGNDVWSKVIKDAGAYRRLIYPFNGALKRYTGLNSKKLYKAAYQNYKEEVDSMLAKRNFSDYEYLLEPEKRLVTIYEFPQVFGEKEVLAVKSSRKETAHLVKINKDGKEQKLTSLGVTSNTFISLGAKTVVWLENEAHPRWAHEDFRRVVSFDLETLKKNVNLRRTKAIFGAIDKDDDRLALVSLTENQKYNLEVKSLKDSSISLPLDNKENWAIAYPAFSKGYLFYLAKKGSQVSIIKHHIQKDSKQRLLPWMAHALSDLYIAEESVFFRGDFEGIDNIYKVSTNGGEIKTITSAKVGAMSPAVGKDSVLIYSNAVHTGRYLASLPLSEVMNRPVTVKPLTEMEEFSRVNSLSESESILDAIPEISTEVNPYKGAFKGWRLHSWQLSRFVESGNFSSGFRLDVSVDDFLEQNKLSPFVAYSVNEKSLFGGVDYSFGKYFTLLNLGYKHRDRKVRGAKGSLLRFQEQEFRLGFSVPLSWINGNYFWQANIESNLAYIDFINGNDATGFSNAGTNAVDIIWQLSSRRQRALQNLQSRYGFDFTGKWATSISNSQGRLFRSEATVFLPGLAINHGIQLTGAFQRESFFNPYQFQDIFDYPRGLEITSNNGVRKLSLDYKLPLLYPDFGFGGLIYSKRIRASFYYDLGWYDFAPSTNFGQSTGMEIRLDNTYLNNITFPVGLRVGCVLPGRLSSGGLFFNLLLGG